MIIHASNPYLFIFSADQLSEYLRKTSERYKPRGKQEYISK